MRIYYSEILQLEEDQYTRYMLNMECPYENILLDNLSREYISMAQSRYLFRAVHYRDRSDTWRRLLENLNATEFLATFRTDYGRVQVCPIFGQVTTITSVPLS